MDLSPAMQPIATWSTAVPDWADRIMAGKPIVPDLPLHDDYADKALRIFKRLRVPDLIGKPTYGEVCDDWVFDFVRAIFGCYDPETRARMIQEIFLLVPKKNGKSAIAAAIIVTAAILNERPAAELILIAPTHNISEIAFNQAKGIIAADDHLAAVFHVKMHLKQIVHRSTEAVIKILAADGDVVTGSKATYVLIDETHVLGSKPKAAEIFLELRGGLASRPEGFLLQITTQSKKPPSGQFRKELAAARGARDGTEPAPILAVLYELPPAIAKDDGWKDPALWGLVNPNLGRSVSMEFLKTRYARAESDGRDDLALFASQHLNVQIGQGTIDGRWAGATFWADSAIEMDLADMIARCEVMVAGIDGGGLDDLLGLTFIGRERDTKRWLSWSRAWAHEIVLTRRRSIAPELQDFADAGHLTICTGPTQDVDEVVALIVQVSDAGLLPEKDAIGLDPEGVAAILDALIDAGISEEQLRGVSQGYRLNGAIKGAERKLFDGTLAHADQPMMAWCVSNAKTEHKGNATVVTKAESGTAKIDPLMALFNSVVLMNLNPTPTGDALNNFLADPVLVI